MLTADLEPLNQTFRKLSTDDCDALLTKVNIVQDVLLGTMLYHIGGDAHITADNSAPHQLRLLAVRVTQLLKCAGEIETGLLNADKKLFPITSFLKELCAKGKHWLKCGASLHAQVLNQ